MARTLAAAVLASSLLTVSTFAQPIPSADQENPGADTNVLKQPLEVCSLNPVTGFYRDGRCTTGEEDTGTHVVCAQMTDAFLKFTLSQGNDLVTPKPHSRFPGLKPGDRWCLCALRFRAAVRAGVAPAVLRAATHRRALDFVKLSELQPLPQKKGPAEP
jgi:uncharacterized protein